MANKSAPITVGKRIKLLREKRGETQTQLGIAVGLSQKAISNIENDISSLGIDIQTELAKHFDVSHDYLITGVDSKSLLSIICDYVSISHSTISVGEDSYKVPFLKIKYDLLNYLLHYAEINDIIFMPNDLKVMWLDRINENFYKESDDKENCYIELIPLIPQMLFPDDSKKYWKQADLIRELNNEFKNMIKNNAKERDAI